MRRERHNFFLYWLFHLNPTTCGTFRKSQLVSPSASSENRLPSSRLVSQLTAFFQIPQILSASGHDVIHVPGLISNLEFLLSHLWLSHPPRARVNICTQCVHLTNPCSKRKDLSLTNPKGKIYKTKSLLNYNTRISAHIPLRIKKQIVSSRVSPHPLSLSWQVFKYLPFYYYYLLLWVFDVSVSWWSFTRVWVTASLLMSQGLFPVFWPFSIIS